MIFTAIALAALATPLQSASDFIREDDRRRENLLLFGHGNPGYMCPVSMTPMSVSRHVSANE